MSYLSGIKREETKSSASQTSINNKDKQNVEVNSPSLGYGILADRAQILKNLTFFKNSEECLFNISLSDDEYSLFIKNIFPLINEKKLSTLFQEILIVCETKLIFIDFFLSAQSLRHLVFQHGLASLQSILNLENQNFFENFENISGNLEFFFYISLPDLNSVEEFKISISQILQKNHIEFQQFNNKVILNNEIQFRFFFHSSSNIPYQLHLNSIICSREVSQNFENEIDNEIEIADD